jgi:hypothetical protein
MINPFRYFNCSPEVIRPGAMMYLKYPLSLRDIEALLAEEGGPASALDRYFGRPSQG